MPKGPKGEKRPADVVGAAVMVARIATGEIDDTPVDEGKTPREVAEAALARTVGSDVELAYRRTEYVERRRSLMERWARFVTGETGKVVQMARA